MDSTDLFEQQKTVVRSRIENKAPRHEILIEAAHAVLAKFRIITLRESDELLYYTDKHIYERKPETHIRVLLHKIHDRFSINDLNEILDKVRRLTYVSITELDDPFLFCVENGILNIATKELIPHSSDYLLTRKLEVRYDPNATCPKTLEFLSSTTSEKNLQLLLEAFAYCLEPGYPYHSVFLLLGPTRTGKSTTLNLLKSFLGKENVSGLTLQQITNNRFGAFSLFGKLANISPDLPNNAIFDTGTFKALTGEDTIEADRKFKEKFKFENSAKLFFSANEIPKSEYDDSDAFYTRFIILDFPHQHLNDANPKLLTNLLVSEEKSGLLNLLLESLDSLHTRGQFEEYIDIDKKREAYIMGSDPIKAFVLTRCIADHASTISKEKLYSKYVEFCQECSRDPKANNVFSRELKKYFNNLDERRIKKDNKRKTVWVGIRVLT